MKKNSKEGVKPARISPWRKPRSVPRDAWELMERALTASIKENVRARRWRIFFRFVYVFIFIWILVLISLGSRSLNRDVSLVDFTKDEHVALIRMTGIVVDGAVTPLGINAEAMNESLRKAFKNPDAKAVILSINSPGGSPV